MPNGVNANVISEAEAAAQNGRLDSALTILIRARAWLKQDQNISSLPADEQPKALVLRMQIGNAILELKNRQIEELIGESKDDLDRIEDATAEVQDTIGDIQQAARFLEALTKIVGLVTKLF